MNIRDESILRELNLYPLWVRRGVSVREEDLPVAAEPAPVAAEPAPIPAAVEISVAPDMTPPSTAAPASTVNPSADWQTLQAQVRDCTACGLRAGCTQTVFGVGDEQADWLFVGEGPGADEDIQGEPFVGQAGRLLDNMLASIRLKRGDDVYIANVVKCRPPGNRTPSAEEVATCLPYLRQQIAHIKPKLIVALGRVAATALLGRDATLGSLRGTLHDYHGIPLLVTYHPAYLLRSPAEKARAWQDLCLAVEQMKR